MNKDMKIAAFSDNDAMFKLATIEFAKVIQCTTVFHCKHEYEEETKKTSFFAVLVDLRLKNESGLKIAMEICEAGKPLVFIYTTNQAGAFEQIALLEAYRKRLVMRPVSIGEFAQILSDSIQREHMLRKAGSLEELFELDAARSLGPFIVDRTHRTLFRDDGREVELTSTELRLLDFFVSNPNRIICRSELENHIARQARPTSASIDSLILNLRRKIETEPSRPVHLKARPGKGYIFVVNKMD